MIRRSARTDFLRPFVSVVFPFLLCAGLNAQEVTDSNVTDPGRFVVETAAEYTSDENGSRTETFSAPSTLLRTGLRTGTELQVGWSGYQWRRNGDSDNGAGDGSLALKQLITNESITFPRTTLLAGTSLPIGNDAVSRNRFDPVVLGTFAYSFGARFRSEAHAGLEWITESDSAGDRDTDANGIYAVALYYETIPSMELFVETFGEVPVSDGGTPAHTLDAGAVYEIGNGYEIASWYGRGLSDAANNHLLAAELTLSF